MSRLLREENIKLRVKNDENAKLILALKRQIDTQKAELAAIPKVPKKPLPPAAWIGTGLAILGFCIYATFALDKW